VAFRKGHIYGTILVDLEQHRPGDLLPDRDADLLIAWLQAHPGVEIVSRDRSTEFRRAITSGAPEALQVADRWHLLVNLREALERVLDRHYSQLRTNVVMPPRSHPAHFLTPLRFCAGVDAVQATKPHVLPDESGAWHGTRKS
jgi:transposase